MYKVFEINFKREIDGRAYVTGPLSLTKADAADLFWTSDLVNQAREFKHPEPFVITSIDELPVSTTHVLHGDGGMYP